tara:strand:- start:139 stop:528 length:390 start_codon:yes stop_codon:yes gene_type:complete
MYRHVDALLTRERREGFQRCRLAACTLQRRLKDRGFRIQRRRIEPGNIPVVYVIGFVMTSSPRRRLIRWVAIERALLTPFRGSANRTPQWSANSLARQAGYSTGFHDTNDGLDFAETKAGSEGLLGDFH